jgi:aldose sugar dehydrogenase
VNPEDLVTFNQKGKYSSPEFIWKQPAGPTAIKFLNSDKLGRGYQDDMFVGDIEGNLYHFDLDKNRTALDLENENGLLADKIADTPSELNDVIFARGFGGITDIEVGYDGYLYIVSHRGGSIYRIIPNDKSLNEN